MGSSNTKNRFTPVSWKKQYKTVDESFEATLNLLLEPEIDVVKRKTIDEFYRNRQEKAGNPYINVLSKEDYGPTPRPSFRANLIDSFGDMFPGLGRLADMDFPVGLEKGTKTFDRRAIPDTLNVFKETLDRDLKGEYPHAEQQEERESEPNEWKRALDMWSQSGQQWALRVIPMLLGQGEPIYKIPGTIEHDAHQVREPRLIKEYDELYQSNIEAFKDDKINFDSYLMEKYGMNSSGIFDEVSKPKEERTLTPENYYGALDELSDFQDKRRLKRR